jgi:hypothetical protein
MTGIDDGFVCIYSRMYMSDEWKKGDPIFEETIPVIYPGGPEAFRKDLYERAHLNWTAFMEATRKKEPLAFDYQSFEFRGKSWWTQDLIKKDGSWDKDAVQMMSVSNWFFSEGIIVDDPEEPREEDE